MPLRPQKSILVLKLKDNENYSFLLCLHIAHNDCPQLSTIILLSAIYSIMKTTSTRSNTSLKDFRLLFSVRSILFHRPRPLPIRISLEKDVQVIGIVPEVLPALSAGLHRCFSEFTPPIEFRVNADRTSSYTVALYEVEAEEEHLLESAEVKFGKFLDDYLREFQQLEEELGSELRQKDPTPFVKAWKALSAKFTKRIYTSGVRFKQTDGILEFALEPVHRYDEVTREVEVAEQLKKQRRERHEENFKKARTIPNSPDEVQQPIRRGHTESGSDTLISPFQFESYKKQPSPSKALKQNQQPAGQKIVLKGKGDVLSNIIEVSDSLQSMGNSLKTNQVLADSKKHRFTEMSFNSIGEKHPSAEEEGKEPIRGTNVLSISSRPNEDILEIESVIEPRSDQEGKVGSKRRVIQQAVTGVFLLGSVFIIYFLMHPLSKL